MSHDQSLPEATLSYLDRATTLLWEAILTDEHGQRYALAHVCALRVATAVLAARARPAMGGDRRQLNVWVLLAEVAPEFGEWASFFASGANKRAAVEAGSWRVVTEREADDLVRDAERFLAMVETWFGLEEHVPIRVA